MSIFIGLIFAVPAALRAIAIQIVKMAGQGIAMLFGKIFLQLFDARVKDFLDPAAFYANKVVVMAIWVRHFITGYIVRKLDFGSNAGIAKQF